MLREIKKWILERAIYAKAFPGLIVYFMKDSKKYEYLSVIAATWIIATLIVDIIFDPAIINNAFENFDFATIIVASLSVLLLATLAASYFAEYMMIKLANKEVNVLKEILDKMPYKTINDQMILKTLAKNVEMRIHDSLKFMDNRTAQQLLRKELLPIAKDYLNEIDKKNFDSNVDKDVFLKYYATILSNIGEIYMRTIQTMSKPKISKDKFIMYLVDYTAYVFSMVGMMVIKLLNRSAQHNEFK